MRSERFCQRSELVNLDLGADLSQILTHRPSEERMEHRQERSQTSLHFWLLDRYLT